MPPYEPIIGLSGFKIVSVEQRGAVILSVEFDGKAICPHCQSSKLRTKDSFERELRHHSIGLTKCRMRLRARKFHCRDCGRYFNERFPGILKYQRSTEPFKEEVAVKHHQGQARSVMARAMGIGNSTVDRCYRHWMKLSAKERDRSRAPRVIGIDEKFFTKKRGYMTSICDLSKHRVFDLAMGRSESQLGPHLRRMPGRERTRIVVMDLSETFRSIAKKYFVNAMIVADRFHVVRLANQQLMASWKMIDEVGRGNRGLVSLIRRNPKNLRPEQVVRLRNYLRSKPGLEPIYDFIQSLQEILRARVYSKAQARSLVPKFLEHIEMLRESGLKPLKTLGETLWNWREEIGRMWRFSKTNSITEGFNNRIEEIIRRAYGFRNFENLKLRVMAYCG